MVEGLPATYQESLTRILKLEERLQIQEALLVRRNQELSKACNLLELMQLEIETYADSIAQKDIELKNARHSLNEIQKIKRTIPFENGSSKGQAFLDPFTEQAWAIKNSLDSAQINLIQELLSYSLSCISTMDQQARNCCSYVSRIEKDIHALKVHSEDIETNFELLSKELDLQKLEKLRLSNLIFTRSADHLLDQTQQGEISNVSTAIQQFMHLCREPAQRSESFRSASHLSLATAAQQSEFLYWSRNFDPVVKSIESQVSVIHTSLYEIYARLFL